MLDDAIRLFKLKLATGLYEDYSDAELEQLFCDCVTQMEVAESINERGMRNG